MFKVNRCNIIIVLQVTIFGVEFCVREKFHNLQMWQLSDSHAVIEKRKETHISFRKKSNRPGIIPSGKLASVENASTENE